MAILDNILTLSDISAKLDAVQTLNSLDKLTQQFQAIDLTDGDEQEAALYQQIFTKINTVRDNIRALNLGLLASAQTYDTDQKVAGPAHRAAAPFQQAALRFNATHFIEGSVNQYRNSPDPASCSFNAVQMLNDLLPKLREDSSFIPYPEFIDKVVAEGVQKKVRSGLNAEHVSVPDVTRTFASLEANEVTDFSSGSAVIERNAVDTYKKLIQNLLTESQRQGGIAGGVFLKNPATVSLAIDSRNRQLKIFYFDSHSQEFSHNAHVAIFDTVQKAAEFLAKAYPSTVRERSGEEFYYPDYNQYEMHHVLERRSEVQQQAPAPDLRHRRIAPPVAQPAIQQQGVSSNPCTRIFSWFFGGFR